MLKLAFCIGFFLTSTLTANTPVELDGKNLLVYFNDGDTFQIHGTSNSRTSARLKGFNALESYGPVHQWGRWTAKELSDISSEATLEARQGDWHCRTLGAKDKYGRILVDCADLAKDLISKGLAHIMFVNSEDYDADLVQAQQDAIHTKVGMWKKGVPDYILTSVHSTAEKSLADSKAYDRFVSILDGHSVIRSHHNAYDTCEKVAYTPEEGKTASSMFYVPFAERYGANKAECLKN